MSAVISLTAIIPIIFLTEPNTQNKKESQEEISLIQNLRDLPRNYYQFLFVSLLFGLANFTILLFIYHARTVIFEVMGSTPPLFQIGFTISLFIWFNIIYTVLSTPFGSWSDKYGRKIIFSIGLVLFIITCLIFLLTTNFYVLLIAFGVYGAFNAATDGIQKAFTVDLLPPHLKGTGIGLLQTITGFAGILGGMIAGLLYDIDFSLTFLYGALTALIALILFIPMRLASEES